MTFYEAALRVLEASGAPLHVQDITAQSITQGLLSHVGKMPEVTMLARLAAMAKRPRDRKLMVTAKDTFALTDWMLSEDAEALKVTGVPEANPEEQLPPLRPIERHPELRTDFLRAVGRSGERKRRDDEGRRRRYPPIAEVVFELLTEAQTSLAPGELLSRMKAREMASDELAVGAVLAALAEDNQRRIDDGRRPQFTASRPDGDALDVGLDTATDGGKTASDVHAEFCREVGLPFENGRLLSSRSLPGPVVAPTAIAPTSEEEAAGQAAKQAAREAKKGMARLFRRRLAEFEGGAFERACVKVLHAHHFRELKVAKRSKEGPVFTARRRDGSLELRYAIRLMKGPHSVERRHVQELRRDLGHYSAHVGVILAAGEARNDARSEALSGGAMVMVWGGEHLAEKFFEAELGVDVTRIEVYEFDDGFFEQMRVEAQEAAHRRQERHHEKERLRREPAEPGLPGEGGAELAPRAADLALRPEHPHDEGTPIISIPVSVLESLQDLTDAEGDDEEGDDGEESEPGEGDAAAPAGSSGDASAAGEGGRRRRRRRRRRRGGAAGTRPEQSMDPVAPAPAQLENGPALPEPAATVVVEGAGGLRDDVSEPS